MFREKNIYYSSRKLFIKSKQSLINIIRDLVLLLIAFYRVYLSGYFGGNCRFSPSCSCYAAEAFKSLPVAQATRLVFLRLSRCHPLSSHWGYDPLPASKEVHL